MIFSTKSLIASCIGTLVGFIIYYLFNIIFGLGKIGLIITLIFAAIGFGITTLKVPETNNFEITRKTGGDRIDDVIMRAIRFKQKGRKIYVYTKEENEK